MNISRNEGSGSKRCISKVNEDENYFEKNVPEVRKYILERIF